MEKIRIIIGDQYEAVEPSRLSLLRAYSIPFMVDPEDDRQADIVETFNDDASMWHRLLKQPKRHR